MGQLLILLWKNFIWCKRHYIRTALFYIIPLLFASSVFLVVKDGVPNKEDCAYEQVFMPPANPVLLLSSLICQNADNCRQKGSVNPTEYFTNLLQQTSSNQSAICPDQTVEEAQTAILQSLAAACTKRADDVQYNALKLIDFVFNGRLLYFPPSTEADRIIAKMQSALDQMQILKLGSLLQQTYSAQSSQPSALYNLMSALSQVSLCYRNLSNRTHSFPSLSDAIEFSQSLNKSEDIVWGLIHFQRMAVNHIEYRLVSQFNLRNTPAALYLQSLAEWAMTEELSANKSSSAVPDSPQINMAHTFMPKRCAKDETVYSILSVSLFAVLSLGLILLVSSFAGEICYEKSAGLLEFLFIAGVSRWRVKLAWALYCLFFMLTVLLLLCVLFTSAHERLFEHTTHSLLYVTFLSYGVALVSLCFAVASLVPEAQQASITMLVLVLVGYLLPTWGNLVPRVGYAGGRLVFVRICCLLHPTIACMFALSYSMQYEKLELTLNWGNMFQTPVEEDQFGGLGEALVYLWVQAVLYMLLSFYFDLVAPSKYGFKLPFYFFLQTSYWKSSSSRVQPYENDHRPKQHADIEHIEEESRKSIGIGVHGLGKVYGNGFKAVSGLSMNLYSHEITAFLGHNGAGKSTTINMLTGMISPSNGTAEIDGQDIRVDMRTIRRSLGFCPQYDIVYPELSVSEHMHFYGTLKGLSQDKVRKYSHWIFERMQMDNKKQQKRAAMNLSGGMKRKLSIAIAFLGDPTTIILDEPTSAIDPFSRRTIWDLILDYRAKSTILISTHYMQEADILGDRIAIINGGILQCFGTPMYLKAKYGDGSFLKLAHRHKLDYKHIQDRLEETLKLTLVSHSSTETTFNIAHKYAKSERMIDLFEMLERKQEQWEIESFGITETTLEQVFFQVAADHEEEEPNEHNHKHHHNTEEDEEYRKVSGVALYMSHFVTTIIKRFTLARRSLKTVMPLLFTAVLIAMNDILASTGLDGGVIEHSLTDNKLQPRLVFYDGPKASPVWRSAMSYGLGSQCAAGNVALSKGSVATGCLQTTDWPDDIPDNSVNYRTQQCSCSKCEDSAKGVAARQSQLPSGELALSLYNRNVSDYLLKTNELYLLGGLSIKQIQFLAPSQLGSSDIATILSAAELLRSISPVALQQILDNASLKMRDQIQRFWEQMQTNPEADQKIEESFQGLDINYSAPKSPVANPTSVANFESQAKAGANLDTLISNFNLTGPLVAYIGVFVSAPQPMYLTWNGLRTGARSRTYFQKNTQFIKASFQNAFSNVLLRSRLTDQTSVNQYAILAQTAEDGFDTRFSVTNLVNGILLGMFCTYALCMPMFSVLSVIVTEHSTGNKQLQMLMGHSRFMYWLGNLATDLVCFIFSVLCMIIFMSFFPEVFEINKSQLFILAILFGISMILICYVFSFVFDTSRNAILVIGICTFALAFAAVLVEMFREQKWYGSVNNASQILPPYFLTSSIVSLSFLPLVPPRLRPSTAFGFEHSALGPHILRLILCIALLLITLTLLESGLLKRARDLLILKLKKKKIEKLLDDAAADQSDPDVKHEIRRVRDQQRTQHSEHSSDVLIVDNVAKYYTKGSKLAVKGVSFGVRRAECFGLLGVNGAGKSTLFQMLAGFHSASSGDALIMGHSVFHAAKHVCEHMSYCPQHDVLFPSMTVTEHLHHYARIRGINGSKERARTVTGLMHQVGLWQHANKSSHSLSGGNKRKLNFAIAILDNPSVIFLDEMTTGMDPKARRAAWKCLEAAMKRGCSVVITSHSMEECEALCNRLIIMVNGAFKCIGGVQYLKDKYGKNYNIKLRVPLEHNLDHVQQYLLRDLPSAQMAESHQGYLEMSIAASSLPLSELYNKLHKITHKFQIEDFSVSQTSLEHVFVNMVKDKNWDDQTANA